MKKLLCAALVLVMSIMCTLALVACTGNEGADDAKIAKDAITAVRGMYIDKAEETPADYTVIGQVKQNNETYSVEWKVEPAEGCEYSDLTPYITIGEMDATTKLVTISVKKAEKEIKYILTATVKVGSATETVTFDRKVPAKPKNHAGTADDPYLAVNIQELGANLENNTFLMDGDTPKLVYVEGYIVETGRDYGTYAQFIYIVDEYSADKDRNASDAVMILSISYDENSPVTKFTDIGKGDKIKVSGYIQKYLKDSTSQPQIEVSRWKNPTTNQYQPLTVISLEKAVDSRTDAQKVADTLKTAEAELTTTKYTSAGTFDLPTSSVYGVELTWTAATSDYVTVTGNKMTISSIPETDTTVELTATAKVGTTEESKKFTITLTKPADLGTTHAGTEADPFTVADANTVLATLASGTTYEENGSAKYFYIKGYVTDAGSTNSHGPINVYIADTKDATKEQSLWIYSANWGGAVPEGTTLAVGDLVVIKGCLVNYQDKLEVAKGSGSEYPSFTQYTPVGGDNPNPNPGPVDPNATVVTKTIEAYATENNLTTSGTSCPTINLDENITVTASGTPVGSYGLNTGKYYTGSYGHQWRIYQNESPKLTFKAKDGYTIATIKITYEVSNTGVLTSEDGATQYASGDVITANANTVTFSVGNTGVANNGQVRITAIEVTYTATAAASAAAASVQAKKQSNNTLLANAANVALYSTRAALSATVDFSKKGYTNQQAITNVELDSNIEVVFDKGSNSNTPKYYTSGTAVRVYGGGTMTVNAKNGYKIDSITLTLGTGNNLTVDSGTLSGSVYTPEANSTTTSVVFKVSGTSGNRRIEGITVTYSEIQTTPTDEDVAYAQLGLDDITILDNVVFTRENNTIDLPNFYEGDADITFSWECSNTELVTLNSETFVLTVVSFPEKDTKITLTATATYNGKTTEPRVFQVTIPYLFTGAGTQENPYTVADALHIASSLNSKEYYTDENGQAKKVYVKGYVTNQGTVSSDKITNAKIADTIGGTTTLTIYDLVIDGTILTTASDLHLNWQGTFYGYIENYNGTLELTFKGTDYVEIIDLKDSRSAEDKIADALESVSTTLNNVTMAGDVELPASSEVDVTFSWTSNNDIATIVDGKLHVADLPDVDTTVTLTLTATCGTASDEKKVTVVVNKYVPLVTKTASVNIAEYAKANNWVNETAGHTTIEIDSNITAVTEEGGVNARYWNSCEWRLYKDHTLTIKAANGCIIKSIEMEGGFNKLQVNADSYTFKITERTDITSITVEYEQEATYLGNFNNEKVGGMLEFLGCGIRTTDPTGVRFGFSLTLSTSNADTMREVAANIKGLFTLNFTVDNTPKTVKGGVESYRIEGNKLVMDAIIISNFDLNNETHKAILNADITTMLSITVGDVNLEASGTRKIVDVAMAALNAGDIDATTAAKYGYTA